ncbi:hypothetical protein SAMN05421821_11385 [Mucilaginibacter lappiensis]|uniref:Uncharacterized protein n=1 Tax=Mucilaginibacter lappiensis TaxID=354630 RepID=A0ABR6PPS2_9SPHI|nr:hypothetical protein [Mucilaginibacter lappiensis]MBB6111636.1 hypothetical protein [Mucilaginibacter lappiensis]SIR84163.1 hypothetical protein SAMN05421821_11385 [Mucilaginibacter lappiensis]
MSEKKGTNSFRLNLDELTPEELFNKMKKLQNDALKEAGESISGGAQAGTTVLHSSGAGTFSKSFDPGT